MQTEGQVIVTKEQLKQDVIYLLEKLGVPTDEADMTAEVMVDTNAKGIETHGVRWLDIYMQRIQAGSVKAKTKLDVIKEKGSLLILDANHGLGQVAMTKAVEMGVKKAKENGISVVAVRNSNHFGATGFYTELAAKSDVIAFVATNGTPLMAPWGGTDLCIGTNPLSYAFPTKGYPIVLDMATTAIARGKVFVAARKGLPLPEGTALNKDGVPTVDAKEALDGVLLPAAGPKGFGLSLMIDIMAGILTGSNYGTNITSLFGDLEGVQDIGHFAYFINIEDFMDLDEYYEKIEANKARMKSSKLAQGFNQIFMPGEIEAGIREKNLKDGIAIPKPTMDVLEAWKSKY
ncbi:Ldh family oxidoreductase [Fusibacter paucivorans]|uniref:Ldh family oxidoreductase n=1 Tax=Fusibacter paucivorans TaxID=76009 RepID=A0ABS5PMA0_9FIRM|nr:Ldh family oxidoreductase [Fusibacter paucivorans]MBS7526188.1 Ldh family oxidoreductase [Fusibacter paucivorans]